MLTFVYTVLLIALLTGCGQTAPAPTPTPDRHTLQTVNAQALPATLIDEIYQDPGVPPYRFKVFVIEGWFKFEGSTYQQQVRFHSTAEGYPDQRWTWDEFGTCTPSGGKLLCESGFIQNYRFELTQQGNALVTRQNFTDPALEATYTFGK